MAVKNTHNTFTSGHTFMLLMSVTLLQHDNSNTFLLSSFWSFRVWVYSVLLTTARTNLLHSTGHISYNNACGFQVNWSLLNKGWTLLRSVSLCFIIMLFKSWHCSWSLVPLYRTMNSVHWNGHSCEGHKNTAGRLKIQYSILTKLPQVWQWQRALPEGTKTTTVKP